MIQNWVKGHVKIWAAVAHFISFHHHHNHHQIALCIDAPAA